MMRVLLSLLAVGTMVSAASADIHSPPVSDHGPTRKLSRGLSNLAFGSTELIYQPNVVNDREGNAAAATYGVVRGVGRTLARVGYGLYDVVTFPFPTAKGKYTPPYSSNERWKYRGMSEFPPELGWETKYKYSH